MYEKYLSLNELSSRKITKLCIKEFFIYLKKKRTHKTGAPAKALARQPARLPLTAHCLIQYLRVHTRIKTKQNIDSPSCPGQG
jgi:hypothetical protein